MNYSALRPSILNWPANIQLFFSDIQSTVQPTSTSQSDGFNTWVVVGIVVGVIAIAMVAVVAVAVVRKRKQRKKTESSMWLLHLMGIIKTIRVISFHSYLLPLTASWLQKSLARGFVQTVASKSNYFKYTAILVVFFVVVSGSLDVQIDCHSLWHETWVL